MLRSVYPEHEWLPWRFSSPPKNWALDTATQKRFIEWLHQQLGNTKADNYNYLTREIIEKYGGNDYSFYVLPSNTNKQYQADQFCVITIILHAI